MDFKRPPRETFTEIDSPASGHMRMRISPDVNIALGLRVKRPGVGMEGQNVELILTEQESTFMPPYQRLLGDAMHGIGIFLGGRTLSTPNGALWIRFWTRLRFRSPMSREAGGQRKPMS